MVILGSFLKSIFGKSLHQSLGLKTVGGSGPAAGVRPKEMAKKLVWLTGEVLKSAIKVFSYEIYFSQIGESSYN